MPNRFVRLAVLMLIVQPVFDSDVADQLILDVAGLISCTDIIGAARNALSYVIEMLPDALLVPV
jgi:hypothetical protein